MQKLSSSFLNYAVMKFFLSPFGLNCIVFLLALLFSVFQKKRTANRLFIFGGIFLLVISTPWLPDFVEEKLEAQYPHQLKANMLDTATAYDILVLGSGHDDDTSLAPNDMLQSSALSRIIEGIRVWRLVPKSRLITSGFSSYGSPSQAELLKRTALSLGVPDSQMALQEKPTNTYEEAKAYKHLFSGKRKLILVTGAYHMPRAMILFQSQGLHPIPATTFHMVKHGIHLKPVFLPNPDNLFKLDKALHEWVGLIYTKSWLLNREEKETLKRNSNNN